MKMTRSVAILCVAAMLLTAMTGCFGGKKSSVDETSSSNIDKPLTSSAAEPMEPISSEAAIEQLLPSVPDESSLADETSSSAEESVSPTMGIDPAEMADLSGEAKGWGPGGPVDEENRSAGAEYYQELYGKYDAVFIAPSSEKIYLTFDEGYENGYTAQILDVLKEKEVSAVFFVTMPYAKQNPDLIRRMIDEGHVVGNHSNRHITYPSLSLDEAKEDLMSLHQYMLDTYGYEMRLFRFPEGNFSEQTLALVQSCGYRSVFWSFAYRDWLVDDQPDPAESLATMIEKSHPGAVYLLHAVSSTNTQVLGDYIDAMRKKGYVFSDLTVN
ncbi:MAG: polysaccharide deacetylase family protein [Oscillospiraceae bacterium]|nr:polysaccharide deacetylase family protein [Oscillospiraceae bacterium]